MEPLPHWLHRDVPESSVGVRVRPLTICLSSGHVRVNNRPVPPSLRTVGFAVAGPDRWNGAGMLSSLHRLTPPGRNRSARSPDSPKPRFLPVPLGPFETAATSHRPSVTDSGHPPGYVRPRVGGRFANRNSTIPAARLLRFDCGPCVRSGPGAGEAKGDGNAGGAQLPEHERGGPVARPVAEDAGPLPGPRVRTIRRTQPLAGVSPYWTKTCGHAQAWNRPC